MVVTRLFLAVAGAGGHVGGVLVLALDLGPIGDQAADRVAIEEADHEFPACGIEGGDRAGVLVAVHDPVVVAVAVARVVAGEELGPVSQLVVILVATGLIYR